MQKLKPILPTLREKKRYLVYEIISEKPVKDKPYKELFVKIKEFLGVFESGRAGVMSLKYDEKTQKGILRVSHKFVDKLKTALMMIKELGKQGVIVRTIAVTGMLRKAKQEIGG